MEKGPSSYAEYWTSPYNEVEHFGRHGWQMGFENDFIGYSQAAKDLAMSEDSETILSYKRSDGCICKFNKENRHFVVINKDGKIVTFYKIKEKNFMKDYGKWKFYWENINEGD